MTRATAAGKGTVRFDQSHDNSVILHKIRDELAKFEDKLPKLKQVTTILKIVL